MTKHNHCSGNDNWAFLSNIILDNECTAHWENLFINYNFIALKWQTESCIFQILLDKGYRDEEEQGESDEVCVYISILIYFNFPIQPDLQLKY